jgi:hypothetical protein
MTPDEAFIVVRNNYALTQPAGDVIQGTTPLVQGTNTDGPTSASRQAER